MAHDSSLCVDTTSWQAALIAGFSMTALAELNVPDDTPKPYKVLCGDYTELSLFCCQFMFFLTTVITLASELHCVCNTTFITIWGKP